MNPNLSNGTEPLPTIRWGMIGEGTGRGGKTGGPMREEEWGGGIWVKRQRFLFDKADFGGGGGWQPQGWGGRGRLTRGDQRRGFGAAMGKGGGGASKRDGWFFFGQGKILGERTAVDAEGK